MKPHNDIYHVAEISISYSHKLPPSELPQVSCPNDTYELFRESWDSNTIELLETFKCMYLNRSNRVLGIMTISTGGLNTAIVDPARIYSGAIKANARGIILVHNHPSGALTPSEADHKITKQLVAAGKTIGIPILDHLIISPVNYYSMADNADM